MVLNWIPGLGIQCLSLWPNIALTFEVMGWREHFELLHIGNIHGVLQKVSQSVVLNRGFMQDTLVYKVSCKKYIQHWRSISNIFFQQKWWNRYKYNTLISIILIITHFIHYWPFWEKLLNFTYNRVMFWKIWCLL